MTEGTVSSKEKIAILGGGMGSIMTAFQLTATEELRSRYEVTLYQMGWRLGGKLASGTNPGMHDRNEEHGLHVWFGFYDNAFANLKTCYGELLSLQPDFRYPTVFDAFKARDYTPIGHRTYDPDGYGFWEFTWPALPGEPGDCVEQRGGPGIIADFADVIWSMVKQLAGDSLSRLDTRHPLEEHFQEYHQAMAQIGAAPVRAVESEHPIDRGFRSISSWLRSAEGRIEDFLGEEAEKVRGFIGGMGKYVRDQLKFLDVNKPDNWPILCGVELNMTIMKGFLNPKYGLLRDFNLNRIDRWDLREWLLENGGRESIVNGSSLLRALYDIPFAYENGDIGKPNFAAGAALRWAIRTFLNFRGNAMFVPQAGFGEAVIAPYYQVLKARGVEFKFFHKVTGIHLSDDQNEISQIRFAVQAETADGSPYVPVEYRNNLFSWPIEPCWDQLKDGAALRQQKVNFESHWETHPPAGELVLKNGEDFDLVVLGIAGTAMKKRNSEDTLFCEELINASPEFAAWTGNLGTVCTSGQQFWFTKPVTDLGWPNRPATVGGPEPADVWADMSQILETEGWADVANPPRSLHYLCGPLPTTLFDEPAGSGDVPARAHQLCVDVTRKWVEDNGVFDWPGAAGGNGQFDWSVMYDESGASGAARLLAQYLRANIDPTECCGNSFAGTTCRRPDSGDRLFLNLRIVGADTNTGINVTCVEGATISAMKASRSICGSPRKICNENFLGGDFPETNT